MRFNEIQFQTGAESFIPKRNIFQPVPPKMALVVLIFREGFGITVVIINVYKY